MYVLYSFVTLFETSSELGDGILSNPTAVLSLCDKALILAQRELQEQQVTDEELTVKTRIHTRMTGIHNIFNQSFDILGLVLCISLYQFWWWFETWDFDLRDEIWEIVQRYANLKNWSINDGENLICCDWNHSQMSNL